MMDPLAVAKSTRRRSWAAEAAVPVGLFGEQKKMISVLGVIDKSGKKSLSGVHFMYTILSYLPFCPCRSPARPKITLESM